MRRTKRTVRSANSAVKNDWIVFEESSMRDFEKVEMKVLTRDDLKVVERFLEVVVMMADVKVEMKAGGMVSYLVDE